MTKSVFHTPHIHGGFSCALASGEQRLGLRSVTMGEASVYSPAPDISLAAFDVKNFGCWTERWQAFRTVSKEADIIHFNYGASLMDPAWRQHFLLELPFYPKRTRKVMTLQGSDMRMAYGPAIEDSRMCELSLGNNVENTTSGGRISLEEIDRKKARITKIDLHVDRIFALNPDLLGGLPKHANFLPYPYAGRFAELPKRPKRAGPLKIAHLATNRVLKGTGLIEQQLSALSQSYEIETRIIVKQPREVAMAAMDWADIVIDQVCLGWYGAQAVEALAKGKPVMCYLDPQHRQDFLPKGNLGFIETKHQDIAQTLSAFCEDPALLEDYSPLGTAFAMQFHDPATIARKVYQDWI